MQFEFEFEFEFKDIELNQSASKRLWHYLWDRCPGCELEMSKINFQHFKPKMSVC